MLLFSLAIVVGLVFLVLSADRFVAGAAAIANNYGVPHIIIGVTIVSLGTSAPEIIAATFMSIEGRIEMAMGNAIGSNIANIGLVLGITALIAPLPINKKLIRNEGLIMMLITLLTGVLLYNLRLGLIDSLILLAGLIGFLTLIYVQHKSGSADDDDFEDEIPNDMSTAKALILFGLGLAVLIISARILVWGAEGIAIEYGISDAIIGATIIAIGTSLPELAASVASALKKHHDIAIGNIIGSNIFNLLAVLSVPGLISPNVFGQGLLYREYLFMLGITALLFAVLFVQSRRNAPIGKYIGTVFVLVYALYGFIAYQQAVVPA